MASTISAGTTTTTALSYSADTSGVLQLQTNGGTTALTLDTSQNVGVGVTPSAKLDASGVVRSQGYSAPASGAGIEMFYSGSQGNLISYNRTGAAYLQQNYDASIHAFKVSGSQSMTLDASGNLLVGTTTSYDKLSVYSPTSSNQSGITLVNNNGTDNIGNSITFKGSYGAPYTSDNLYAQISGLITSYAGGKTGNLVFSTGSAGTIAERARIDSSGNLLVGTTTASGKFVSSTTATIAYSGYFVNNYTGDGVYSYANANNTTYKSITCSGSSGINFYVYSNGTYGTVSDQRLKKNIETTRNGYIDDVMKLRVVKYNWISDDDGTPKELGWIAQELEQVFPNLVQDSQPDKNGDTRKEVKTSVLPFILLKAIQEQQAMITTLQSQVTTLQTQVTALKG